ncbi:GNAT family N-acetyltransferase [Candidatus Haliotispira prima]|uniref:GNAT family N-acetyltransferase n=1 Tax=Candidatus Haliotispira prima TaxID=3034016 RepID=A0ABY8MKL3_9SPIO|nr:GNAT family N-acetyltransferase [Candidatus Haliotispira prima]
MIRMTNPNDFDGLMSLALASGLFEPEERDLLAQMIRFPGKDDVWFADDGDDGLHSQVKPAKPVSQLVGAAYMAPEKMTQGTWNLYWITVHPDCQRQGRGKAMLDHVRNWLTEKGQRMLIVETAGGDEFDYVRKFYANNGFEAEARIRDFYEAGVDKIVFRKLLGSEN